MKRLRLIGCSIFYRNCLETTFTNTFLRGFHHPSFSIRRYLLLLFLNAFKHIVNDKYFIYVCQHLILANLTVYFYNIFFSALSYKHIFVFIFPFRLYMHFSLYKLCPKSVNNRITYLIFLLIDIKPLFVIA